MSASVPIVFLQNTNTKGDSMFEAMIQEFFSYLWVIMPAAWGCLSVYGIWYLTRAKNYFPISTAEAKQLWMIHRRGMNCDSKRWKQVKQHGTTVGFECECGFKHMQTKPIVGNHPILNIQGQFSSFDRLHTSHKST